MAYLPLISLNRSQRVRLGAGPGKRTPNEINLGDLEYYPKTGDLYHAFYADLNQGTVRRDLQRHSAIGAVLPVGPVTFTHWSDLYAPSGLVVTAGSGYTLNVSAGVIYSRTFNTQLAIPAVTGLTTTLTTSIPGVTTTYGPSTYDRTDLVVAGPNGTVTLIPGGPATAAATYEVDSVAITGTPTGGTFKLAFSYNGFNYITAAIAYNASAATVATAVLAATGGPALPAGTITGTGGALPGTAVTLTASGALEGPITQQFFDGSALTGGTTPAGTFTQTTAGVGSVAPTFGGSALPLAYVFVPSTATSSSNYVITTVTQTS